MLSKLSDGRLLHGATLELGPDTAPRYDASMPRVATIVLSFSAALALALGIAGCAPAALAKDEACAAFLKQVDALSDLSKGNDPSTKEGRAAYVEKLDAWVNDVKSINGPEKFNTLRDAATGAASSFSMALREVNETGETNLYVPTGSEVAAPAASLGSWCILDD